MDYPKRKDLRLSAYDYRENGAYFVTICTQNRAKSLSVIENGSVRLLPLGRIAEQFLLQLPQRFEMDVDRYVIMPDHIHMLLVRQRATTRVAPTLGQVIGAYKSLVDHQWRQRRQTDRIWQRGFYEHVIRNQQDYFETYRYIEDNPIRWTEQNP